MVTLSVTAALCGVEQSLHLPSVRKPLPFLSTASAVCFLALFVAILDELFSLRKLGDMKRRGREAPSLLYLHFRDFLQKGHSVKSQITRAPRKPR